MDISKYNPDGYLDLTAYQALKNIENDQRKELPKKTITEHEKRCWDCTLCNHCGNAFKMTTLCEKHRPRKRRMRKDA